jgi:predicted ATPase/nitrogen-specific signal transduction histidine kinase
MEKIVLLPAISGYVLEEVLFSKSDWIWYIASQGEEKCVIKVYCGRNWAKGYARLKHEKYLCNLVSDVRLPRAKDLQEESNFGPYLVLEPFHGVSLRKFTAGRLFPVETVLAIAGQLCSIVALLHSLDIQHGGLSPELFFIDPETEKIRLVSLEGASTIKKKPAKIIARRLSAQEIHYIAPEQTGYALSNFIDFRADIFTCGAILYELLLGKVPWPANDAKSFIQQLLSQDPIAPREIDPAIPQAVSDIVMRCLNKEPAERYSSALQLSKDLEDCREQLRSHGIIFDTSFTEKAALKSLLQPTKLIGQSQKEELLKTVYLSAALGRSQWLLIKGEAGSGKTALTRTLLLPTAERNGYFIRGNFGEQKQHIPYSALGQAIGDLIDQLLEENELRLEAIKRELLGVLEGHGSVLIEIFPTLEKLIGPQPNVSFLKSQESQTRQLILFKRMLNVIASKQTPLIIFLDDVQWADAASLRLVKALIVDPLIKNLLVLSCHRSELVQVGHPVTTIVEEIGHEEGVVVSYQVTPLSANDIATLLHEMVPRSILPKEYKEIAAFLEEKCAGNPFFLKLLLERLFEEKALFPECLVEEISISTVGWSMQGLLMWKIGQLPTSTQSLLSMGAQIDNTLYVHLIAIASKLSSEAVLKIFWHAVQSAIIAPVDESYYLLEEKSAEIHEILPISFIFLENGYYDVAFHALPSEDRIQIHYTIGSSQLLSYEAALFMKQAEEVTHQKKVDKIVSRDGFLGHQLFDIIFHLNSSMSRLTTEGEKLQLAALNLEACKKAQEAVANKLAYESISAALMLLPQDSWETNYDLTYAIYHEATTCAYLMRQFAQIEEFSDIILSKAKTILDQGRLYLLKINFYTNTSHHQLAIREGITCLNLFGISLMHKPSKARLLFWLAKIHWMMSGKKISELAFLPAMKEERQIFVVQVLAALLPAAFIVDKELVSLIVLHMMDHTLRFGICDYSFYGVSTYAGVIEIVFRNYPKAYELGLVALQMAEKTADSSALSRANYTMAILINHWTHPLATSRFYMDYCYNYGVTAGELVLLSFIGMFYGFLDGEFFYSLDKAFQSVLVHKGLLLACKNELALESFHVREAIISALESDEFDGKNLLSVGFDEKVFLLRLQGNPELYSAVQAFVAYKMLVLCVFGFYSEALELFNSTAASRRSAITLITERILNFYHSLSLAGLYNQAGLWQRWKIKREIKKNQKLLKWWTKCCEENNVHRYLLIEAELARINGQRRKAIELYDLSAAKAHQGNHLMEEALIKERAAEYHLELQHQIVSQGYLSEAFKLYEAWGSSAKLKAMRQKYFDVRLELTSIEGELPAQRSNGHRAGKTSLIDALTISQALDCCYMSKEALPQQIIAAIAANAGADKAAFIFLKNEEWQVLTSDSEKPFLLKENGFILPAIHYAIRTGHQLLVEDASSHAATAGAEYSAKSLLVIPLHKQHGVIHSLLYLENRTLSSAFSEKMVPLLAMLGSILFSATANTVLQKETAEMANSLEVINNRLKAYSEELEQKIAKRTGELEDKNRELEKSMIRLESMQKQMLQREKMAGMGSLTQGFAHEIKNPLNFINNFASLSRDMLDDLTAEKKQDPAALAIVQQLQQLMAEILEEGQRADNIIVNMQQFSAPATEEQSTIDFNEFISNLVSIVKIKTIQKYSGLPMQLEESYAVNIPPLRGWVRRLGQAISNLLEYVTRELMAKWEEDRKFIPNLQIRTTADEQVIALEIKANLAQGGGKKEVLPSGLGITMAKDIVVNEHNGAMECRREGEYIEFFITFPLMASV